MIKRVSLAVSALFIVAACGSDADSSSGVDVPVPTVEQTPAPAPEPAPETEAAPESAPEAAPEPAPGDGCPYLTDEALSAAMGIGATLVLGDQNGCQWSMADGSQGLLSRWMADYYDDNAGDQNYLGDIDGVTGRWGNQNVMVSISGEYTLLYTDSLRGTPLREELQAVGRALVESN